MADKNFDTNVVLNEGAPVSLTNEQKITLFVSDVSGSHKNHEIGLMYSPDGVRYYAGEKTITGLGIKDFPSHGAQSVYTYVKTAEGEASVVDIDIMPR